MSSEPLRPPRSRLAQRSRSTAKAAIHRSGVARRRAARSGGAHIIMFHGVGGDDLSSSAFRRVLAWLKLDFDVVSLDVLVGRLAGDAPMEHCVGLTFDDGLKNNLTVAHPVLQELGLPATFFVCPGLIDVRGHLWTHDARFRMEFLRDKRGEEGLDPLRRWGWIQGRDPVEWMKQLPIEKRRQVEEWLANASTGFTPDAEQASASDLLDWDDLRALDGDLITIGSHTLDHPMLSSLPPSEAEQQIYESASLLQSELDRPIDYFCYPNGDRQPAHMDIVRNRYRAAVGVSPGVNRPGHDLADLSRIAVSARLPDLSWALHRASA